MTEFPASSLLADLQAGRRSAREVTVAALAAARDHGDLNAFIRLHDASAVATAEHLDERLASGATPGALHGLPVALKDNIDEAGERCAGACDAYRDRRPRTDAPVVERLRKAGAVLLGRTNMHELADGVTSENEAYGPVVNPHRPGYHPGGSSGGSAAAVGAGIVPAALGTDTGGSVRIPASLCGVVGIKPTAGRVPTQGVMPLSTTLDHVGVLADSVATAATVLGVLVQDPGLSARCVPPPAPLRLGVLHGFARAPDPEVAEVHRSALERLLSAGHHLKTHRVDSLARGIPLLSAIYPPEAARWHRTALQERPEQISPSIRLDLRRGLRPDAEDRRDAALGEILTLIEPLEALFEQNDLLLCPTTPHPAKPFGSPSPHTYLSYTCPFNLTGHPAISVPMGLVDGLPVGMQIVGPRNHDEQVLALGRALEDLLRSPRPAG